MAPETLSLVGKTALVTGSGRENGIGAAIAGAFARNGAAVAINYVSDSSKAKADKVAANISKEFGTKVTVVQGSVETAVSAKRIVEQTLKGLGADHIDILVNNAGYAGPQILLEATQENLAKEFGVNVFGAIYMIQAAVGLGKMPKGGRIINIGTIASKLPNAGTPIYSAAKATLDSLTASWAAELGQSHGITVNTLAPGPIGPTDMSKPFMEGPDGTPSQMQEMMKAQALAEARIGTVEDMADAALLIVSEKSRWITAQWISISGGLTGTM